MTLAGFLQALPRRLFEIEEDLFRDVPVRLAEPEVQALVDLALEGALARRSRGEEVTPLMVSALVQLERAADRTQPVRDVHAPDPTAIE